MMDLNRLSRPQTGFILGRLVGAMDFLTGLLLIANPFATLALMGITQPNDAVEIFLRWIGVFVASVGFSYFLPAFSENRESAFQTLRVVFIFTALVRLGVACFLTWAILDHRLETAWVLVLISDASVALLQWFYLRITQGVSLSGSLHER